jgi:hypothetical protein
MVQPRRRYSRPADLLNLKNLGHVRPISLHRLDRRHGHLPVRPVPKLAAVQHVSPTVPVPATSHARPGQQHELHNPHLNVLHLHQPPARPLAPTAHLLHLTLLNFEPAKHPDVTRVVLHLLQLQLHRPVPLPQRGRALHRPRQPVHGPPDHRPDCRGLHLQCD